MNAAPRNLVVLAEALAQAGPDGRGALWRLAEQERELDANLVRLPPDAEVGGHQEDTLDVLLVVLDGSGVIITGDTALPLTPTTVTWLPRTSRRAVQAGPEGLAYLTVHRRRPGLRIAPAPPGTAVRQPGDGEADGGEAPCALDRVCPECGRLTEGRAPKFCAECGERLGGR
ncbi:cupin domain-containing protein [Streptomyces sp. NPDC060184]|uniref:cupin domain-containing protein n=1 Tax=Streptomyces sp. NPDC060184 TaxID=3347064 RepID=UPI0036528B83